MSEYMRYLKNSIGFTLLKKQYNTLTAKLFNKMEDSNAFTMPEDIDKYIREDWEDINFDNIAEEDTPSEDESETTLVEKD